MIPTLPAGSNSASLSVVHTQTCGVPGSPSFHAVHLPGGEAADRSADPHDRILPTPGHRRSRRSARSPGSLAGGAASATATSGGCPGSAGPSCHPPEPGGNTAQRQQTAPCRPARVCGWG